MNGQTAPPCETPPFHVLCASSGAQAVVYFDCDGTCALGSRAAAIDGAEDSDARGSGCGSRALALCGIGPQRCRCPELGGGRRWHRLPSRPPSFGLKHDGPAGNLLSQDFTQRKGERK